MRRTPHGPTARPIRRRIAVSLAMAAASVLAGAPALAASPSCRPGPAETLTALTLTSEGDLASPDGRVWILAGLAWPGAAPDGARRLGPLLGAGPFQAAAVAGRPDRWGRLAAVVAGPAGDLAAAAVREGWAAVRAADLPAGCARALLDLEREARQAGRGLWGEAATRLDAADPAAILAHVGRHVVVEGRVLDATERKTRAYLNFGAVWSEDFTVTVSKRTLNRIEASGMRWSSLRGRRVRVRGVVADSGGPLIEVSAPEELEQVD